jgi:hypothetical protein
MASRSELDRDLRRDVAKAVAAADAMPPLQFPKWIEEGRLARRKAQAAENAADIASWTEDRHFYVFL